MVNRKAAILLGMLMCALVFAPNAEGLTIASGKVGVGFIPDGKIFGGHAKVGVGPFSFFTEFFKKSGTTTANFGGNLLSIKLPSPSLKPYFECGGGISRSSGGDTSKTYLMLNAVAGAEMGMSAGTGLFGQVKYIYTFGTETLAVRDVAIQAGLVFNLGL